MSRKKWQRGYTVEASRGRGGFTISECAWFKVISVTRGVGVEFPEKFFT